MYLVKLLTNNIIFIQYCFPSNVKPYKQKLFFIPAFPQ